MYVIGTNHLFVEHSPFLLLQAFQRFLFFAGSILGGWFHCYNNAEF